MGGRKPEMAQYVGILVVLCLHVNLGKTEKMSFVVL